MALDLSLMIKEARQNKKLTQLQLAKKLGYTGPQFIHLIESGKSKVPMNVIAKLAEELDLPMDKILKDMVEQYVHRMEKEIKGI